MAGLWLCSFLIRRLFRMREEKINPYHFLGALIFILFEAAVKAFIYEAISIGILAYFQQPVPVEWWTVAGMCTFQRIFFQRVV